MSADSLRLERDGHVAILTIDRPDKLNAMTVAMDERMNELVYELNGDAISYRIGGATTSARTRLCPPPS